MLLINCPWCGPRDETEFSYGGEAHRVRPADPSALTDEQWADFLFMRTNPKGAHKERWVHSHGCRRWFNVERHTVTHQILNVYPPASAPQPVQDIEAANGDAAPASSQKGARS
ncbi:sarcosine oxidase subunit delta [Azospirillum sp. SYSU D00513]|uniref:sarcosine oxidase subunit delta n=1 Tax=Azospirillum sp. SYSU D00513 TaxID=2812561 RepID=UPI001A9727B7|nr:sarcosine oxidase subunit delta [Azospirillum sp. SYSU D00513]